MALNEIEVVDVTWIFLVEDRATGKLWRTR
jgi:hypothetical protein